MAITTVKMDETVVRSGMDALSKPYHILWNEFADLDHDEKSHLGKAVRHIEKAMDSLARALGAQERVEALHCLDAVRWQIKEDGGLSHLTTEEGMASAVATWLFDQFDRHPATGWFRDDPKAAEKFLEDPQYKKFLARIEKVLGKERAAAALKAYETGRHDT